MATSHTSQIREHVGESPNGLYVSVF